MILVSGTKRSGTSMWMQILRMAGFPVWGDAFPRDWGQSIRAANPRGFFESSLRRGVYSKTNPDPRTGLFLSPRTTRRLAVKVFARGIVRTERAYLDHVIASMRPIAEYVRSVERLYQMEREHRARRHGTRAGLPGSEVLHMPPALEWWHHNYMLLRDAEARRYAITFVSYDAVLRAPEQYVPRLLGKLGPCDLAAGLACIDARLRTQQCASSTELHFEFTSAQRAAFEELYDCVDRGLPFGAARLRAFAAIDTELAPQVARAREALRAHRMQVHAAREAGNRKSA
ncbi:MAG: hypothetical protein RL385_2821 [Pseudomonadota bacterium]|jgi:hypothetical protein